MSPSRVLLNAALLLLFGITSTPGAAQKYLARAGNTPAEGPAVIWHDPGPVERLDLFRGAGGEKYAPNPRANYTFVHTETKGANLKFDVEDDQGVRWRVKLGEEAQSETTATRLVWAGGYFVDEAYYLPEIRVTGVPKEFLSREGAVVGARLE